MVLCQNTGKHVLCQNTEKHVLVGGPVPDGGACKFDWNCKNYPQGKIPGDDPGSYCCEFK